MFITPCGCILVWFPTALQEEKTVAQATASLYGVKTYPEQLAFKEKVLMDELFLTLPGAIRLVQQLCYGSHVVIRLALPTICGNRVIRLAN